MPRVSQAVARQTRQKIIDSAYHIVLKEGIEQLTFSNIANRAGISRSGINAHFKRKEDLYFELRGMVSERMKTVFNYNSPQEFYDCWVSNFNSDPEFRRIIISAGAFFSMEEGINKLKDTIKGNPVEIDMYLKMAVGHSVIHSHK
ncbi:TetR/AcrR family transcriptional regulator [Photobacterium sp. SDRW27]|uniref:TetR/AcrR family transcriptional regulator n=1 Tax=Photobacterium obscurum TaxID=2829490 RepID=UPI002242ECFF|nr:TetR/AcrR family transcriptional regulator [Photobacterium obscurum]MCW8332113.1 TetR/AcrR family transcriptional regulator [Photobacterium obscurum]